MRYGILALALLAGCESVDSTDVLTSGVYADLDVEAYGDGTSRATAVLKVGGVMSNTYLDLVDDDRLVATAAADSQDMQRYALGDYMYYYGDFEEDAAETPFQVSFERGVDGGAPSSTVALPQPFVITSPAEGLVLSRGGDDLVIRWDNTQSDDIRWQLRGDCIETLGDHPRRDRGEATLWAREIQSAEDQEEERCTGTVTVTRTRHGALDPAYEGGHMLAHQVREVEIELVP